MKIVSLDKTLIVFPTVTTKIFEYDTEDLQLGGSIAEVNGRYPEKGFAKNTVSKELAYVIEGEGKIITPTETRSIKVGDVIFLDTNELFAWEGKLKLFMVTSPTFDPNQHKVIDG